jgi:hypothetical protein
MRALERRRLENRIRRAIDHNRFIESVMRSKSARNPTLADSGRRALIEAVRAGELEREDDDGDGEQRAAVNSLFASSFIDHQQPAEMPVAGG